MRDGRASVIGSPRRVRGVWLYVFARAGVIGSPDRFGDVGLTVWPRAGGVWQRRLRLDSGFLAMSFVTLLVAFLVLFPLGMLVFGSFWTSRPGFPGALTLDNYIKAYTDL